MRIPRWLHLAALLLAVGQFTFASAYNAHPKLVVVIVIDQFRGDYLERYHDQFGEGGFRLLMEHGAYFTDCNYDYANTRTGPGHATLFTGSYSIGHGIMANEWWDPEKKKFVTSVEDSNTKLVGASGTGSSPHNLMTDTIGDELKLATAGKSRVFGISLKDRAAVLPAGFAANGAYWIDGKTGAWVTSTYYPDPPEWVANFNGGHRADKYWNREWKSSDGTVLASTAPRTGKDGSPVGFYEIVGGTAFANDYELEFAKELIVREKLGSGPTTDFVSISLSANDILGHRVGPDSPQMHAMALDLDRQLAEFFGFLGHQIGLANTWIALSADHGVSPLPKDAAALHLPAAGRDTKPLHDQINAILSKKYGKQAQYLADFDYPLVWLDESAFLAAGRGELDAESDTAAALRQLGFVQAFTKSQLARGDVPNTELGRRYAHSYSPHGGWYVMAQPTPFFVASASGTDHATPFSYDTHVPLAFYGLAFQPGVYRTHAEPIDLAVTLASLLGVNAPAQATGRVLTEALAVTHQKTAGSSDTQ